MIENISVTTAALVAMVVGLVQAAKYAGLASRFGGVLAVFLGLLLGVFTWYAGILPLYDSVVSGIVTGLTAAGAYSGTKALLK